MLDACLREGIWLPHACTHGTCGTCKAIVLEGNVDHGDASPYALLDSEREEGCALICVAKARSFPDPPGLGILRSRTGSGRNEPFFKQVRRSSRNPDTPTTSSTWAAVRPSTPGVFAPWLARSIPPAEAPIQSVPDTSPSVCDIAAGTGEESTHIEQE